MTNNIKKIRKEQGLTLAQLSKKTKLSIGYLCHLENGSRNNPSMQTVEKICISLQKSLYEVFVKNRLTNTNYLC